MLLSGEDILFDAHAHAITKHHIPKDFKPLLEWVSNSVKMKIIKLIDERVYEGTMNPHPNNNITRLLDIYQSFIKTKLPNKQTKMLLCILMMDFERGISNKELRHNFKEQIKQMVSAHKSGSKLKDGTLIKGIKSHITFMAADPHNPDLYDHFISGFCKEHNTTDLPELDNVAIFQGLKLYPVLGYKPADRNLFDLYRICEGKRIPITAHCGGVRTRTKHKIIEVSEKQSGIQGDIVENIEVRCDSKAHFKMEFVEPFLWLKVLGSYPDLKLNLAHFGDDDEWAKYRRNPTSHSHVNSTLELIRDTKYPNVYADISYAVQDPRNIDIIIMLMQDERYKHRILCGTDYYLNEYSDITTEDALTNLYEKCRLYPKTWKRLTMENPKKFFFDL